MGRFPITILLTIPLSQSPPYNDHQGARHCLQALADLLNTQWDQDTMLPLALEWVHL